MFCAVDPAKHLPARRLAALTLVLAVAILAFGASIAAAHNQRTKEPSASFTRSYMKEHGVSEAAARARLKRQHRGYDIAGALESALGDRFAGVWFDNDNGRFSVPVVDGAREPAARAIEARGLADIVDYVPAQHTHADLKKAQRAAGASLADLMNRQLLITSVDDDDNALRLEVSSAATREERARVDAYARGAAVRAEVEERPSPEFAVRPAACAFPNCSRPMRGGVAIGFGNNYQCTSGFYAWGNGRRYILTAGHCVDDPAENVPWQAWDPYSSPYIFGAGNRSGFYYNQNGDAGLIDATSTWWDPGAWQPRTAAWGVNEDHITNWRDYSWVGMFYCKFGISTGNTCGTVQSRNVGIAYTDGRGTHYNMTKGTACALPGDSGGPIIHDHGGMGITSGSSFSSCSDAGRSHYYTEARDAEYGLGITVAHTG